MLTIMHKDQRWVNPTDPGILRKRADVDNELLIFGYACTLFRDDQKALEMDQGKHLIPWNGMESLKIDRYDARGHLSELSQFESSSYGFVPTQEEKEIEKLCDKERYLALEPNEEEHLMYQEEEFKRLQQTLSNNEYGQVAYQYTDDSQPQSTTSNSEGSTQEDVVPFVPSPLLDIPQNMVLPSSKKENQIIEKAASYIAAHGSQVEIIVKTRQANNEKLGFMHVGSPLNPYYNFILDRIKHGRYRPGSLLHTQEEIEQNEDYLHPILSSSSVESAPSIPNIAYKASGDSSYDLLVKNIRNVQQTHKVASEIHVPSPAKKKCLPSNKNKSNGRLSLKNQNSTKKITVQDNPQNFPPANIREIISKLLNFARTMGLHPSELAPNLLMKKSKNIEFLLPENPYHWYYKEQLGLLFKDKQESVQRSATLSTDNSAYDPEALMDSTESSLTNSEEVTTETEPDKKVVNTEGNYPPVEESDITAAENPMYDEALQLLMVDDDSLGNDRNHSEGLRSKDLKKSKVLSPHRSASCENHVPNQPSHRPAPVSFSIKKPKEEKLEITSALPVEESSSEDGDDENSEKAVENSAEKTAAGVEKKRSKKKDNKPVPDFSKPQYEVILNKTRKSLLEQDQPPQKTEETLQGNDSRKNEQKVFVKPAPSTLNGTELIESVKTKALKKKGKSTKIEKQREKKAAKKPSKTKTVANVHKDYKRKKTYHSSREKKIRYNVVAPPPPPLPLPPPPPPPPPPKEVASPLPPSPLASPPPPDVDRIKKEERKKRAKVLISKLKNCSNDSVELEEESSQELEEPQLQCASVTSSALTSKSNPFTPMPPSKFTSFLPQGPDNLLHTEVEKVNIVEKESKHKEEHLRKRVKKSLQELARNMKSTTISSQSDEEYSQPLVTTKEKTNTKEISVATVSNITCILSSGYSSNKSVDGSKKLYLAQTYKKIRPSTTLEVTESLLTSLAKTKRKKKYARDTSSDSLSSNSSDSSTGSEEESISDESSSSSKNSSKKRSHRKHSKHSHKKRKKHHHHSKKSKSSKHSKKCRRSHRKKSRRSCSSSSD